MLPFMNFLTFNRSGLSFILKGELMLFCEIIEALDFQQGVLS